MSNAHTIYARRLADGTLVQELADGTFRPLDTTSDWARVDAMTDEEVVANSLADPDDLPMTPEEFSDLAEFVDLAQVRALLGLSQEAFAARFGLALDDLRAWERAYRPLDAAVRGQ